MSHREPAARCSRVWLPAIRMIVVFGAFVASSGLTIYSAWPRPAIDGAAKTEDASATEGPAAAALADAVGPYDPAAASAFVDSLDGSVSAAAGRSIRVALFREESSCDPPDDLRRILESELLWSWAFVSPSDVQGGMLDRFDVVIIPGGRASKQAAALGARGQQAVRDYVRAGGGYVGICGGAFLATAHAEYLAMVSAWTLREERNVPGVGLVSMATRGPATVKMELTEAGRRVFGDVPVLVDVNFAGGPIFRNRASGNAPAFVALAHYRSEVSQYEPQRGTMIHTPSIIAARFGLGRLIAFSPHPEVTTGLEWLVKRAIAATARDPVAAKPAAVRAVSRPTSNQRDP
jgi:glutamine amidotransferase-like uncharacterized protein